MPDPIRYENGWRVNFSKDGKKVRKWFPAIQYLSDEGAYAAARHFIEEILSGKPPEKSQSFEIKEKIGQYNTWSERVRRKSPETIRKQVNALSVFARFCEKAQIASLGKIDTTFILEYQEWFYENAPFSNFKRREGYDPSANWRKYHEFLSSFFNWCMRRGYIEENPARHPDFRPKIQNKVPTIFSSEELELLFQYFDPPENAEKPPGFREKPPRFVGYTPESGNYTPRHKKIGNFFRLLLYTGMRPGEAIRLKWSDVNLPDGVIQVAGQTKTKQVRSIPIHPALHKILESMPKDYQYVFDSGQNEPVGDDSYYYRELRRACVIMKIKPHRVYDFRHTFAANLVIGGVHIGAVRELLGHARIEQTLAYIHFAPMHLKSAVESLSFSASK